MGQPPMFGGAFAGASMLPGFPVMTNPLLESLGLGHMAGMVTID